MPMHTCKMSGCYALIDISKQYCCPAHKSASGNARAQKSPESKKFYSSSKWQKVRKLAIQQRPMCQCGCGETNSSLLIVDHIKEILDLPYKYTDPMALNLNNLTVLCRSAHTIKTNLVKKLRLKNNGELEAWYEEHKKDGIYVGFFC